MKITKKEKKRILKLLSQRIPVFIECPEFGDTNMQNKEVPVIINWEKNPVYKVTYKKDGTYTRKEIKKKSVE